MTDEELKQETGDELSELERLVFQAVSHASMCWNPLPTGLFDSEEAIDVVHKLVNDIRELYKV